MFFNHLTRAILLVALAVILRNGLHRKCWTFVAYVISVLTCGSLMAYWPGVFYNAPFYGFSRDLYAGLKLLVALEVGMHVLEAFPRARAVARTLAAALLAVVVLSVAAAAPWLGWSAWQLSRARLNAGTIWLFAGLAIIVLWYNLPLDRWHRVLLAGFTVQLLVSSSLLSNEVLFRRFAVMVDPVVAMWWVYGAWPPAWAIQSLHARRSLVGRSTEAA